MQIGQPSSAFPTFRSVRTFADRRAKAVMGASNTFWSRPGAGPGCPGGGATVSGAGGRFQAARRRLHLAGKDDLTP